MRHSLLWRHTTLLMAILCLTIAACATQTRGRDFNSAAAPQIKSGVTTREDVLRLLGEPYNKEVKRDGTEHWAYIFEQAKGQATAAYVFTRSNADMKMDVVTKILDVNFRNGVVIACQLQYGSYQGTAEQTSPPRTTTPCGDVPATAPTPR